MLVFATGDDLAVWSGAPAPGNSVGLLRAASVLVSRAARGARYRAGSDGLPSDPQVLGAFRDATTSQAAFWAANDIDPVGGSVAEASKGHAIGKSIKGASVSYSVTLVENANKARTAAITGLCDEAWGILDAAGLTRNHVTVV